MSKVIHIEKKSVVPLEEATGAVSDTLNVADKVKNAPSINLVQQMTGIPQGGIIEFEGDEIPEGYELVAEEGWKNINDSDGNTVAYYRKTGKIVEVRLGIWSDSANYIVPAYHKRVLGTLPEDCRPSFTLTINPLIVPTDRTQQPVIHFRVNTDGNLEIENWYTEVKCVYISGFISYVV